MNRAAAGGVLTAVALLLVGCSADDVSLTGLPGPVPEHVTFPEPPATAPPAPEFELELLGGELVTAETQWAERPLVLVFFEAWCESCREQQDELNDLAEDYRDAVLFLGIAEQSPEPELLDYVADNDVNYPVGIDSSGDVWFDYAATEPPLLVLISKGGKVLRGWPGGLDGEALRAQIDELAVNT